MRARRIAALPDLVTLKDLGFEVDLAARFGFFAPKGTPEPILDRLARVFLAIGGTADYAERMRRGYSEVLLLDRAAHAVAMAEEERVKARLVEGLRLT